MILNKTAVNVVHNKLREEVIKLGKDSKYIDSARKLNVASIADECGVSKTPVREALKKLEEEVLF